MPVQDFNRLQVFREVVQAGSFSKAAASLKQPKSRVSRHIAELEKNLGVQLIYRTTRQFQLTHAGQDLYRKSAPLLKALSITLEETAAETGEVAGLIRVTAPEDLGTELMGRFCHEFMKIYPKVQIQLVATNAKLDLIRESIDLAVRVGANRDSTMIQKKVGAVELLFVASPQFLKRHPPLRKLDDLESLPFLAFGADSAQNQTIKVSRSRESRNLKMNIVLTSNNFFALRSMAVLGTGVALIPAFLVRGSLETGALIQIFRDWSTGRNPIHLLAPQQKVLPLRVRKFMDFLSVQFQEFLT